VLEGVLREMSTFGIGRDPDLYYLTLFGEPSNDKAWAFRFEGHHLSLHFSSATGRLVSSTPAFFGAEPSKVLSGPHAGLRVLGDQEDAARRLFDSLDAAQRKVAIIATSAPGDIILSPSRKSVPDPEGLPASQMTDAQRKLLMELIAVYTGNLREDLARAQIGRDAVDVVAPVPRLSVAVRRRQWPTFTVHVQVVVNAVGEVCSEVGARLEPTGRTPIKVRAEDDSVGVLLQLLGPNESRRTGAIA